MVQLKIKEGWLQSSEFSREGSDAKVYNGAVMRDSIKAIIENNNRRFVDHGNYVDDGDVNHPDDDGWDEHNTHIII